MKKEYILFIDSGIGGLSTLAETYKIVPAEFIYFADNKNQPYGSHTKKEIVLFLSEIIDFVRQKFSVKIVVLACNTATTAAIETLRKFYPDICFVGTEPAIKYAHDLGFKNILVLSTPATAKQKKYKDLLYSFACDNVKTLSLDDFAQNIECFYHASSPKHNIKLLKNLFDIKSASKNYDAVVLGCTHYCLLKNQIHSMTNLPIISGNLGVSRRVLTKYRELFDQNSDTNCNPNVIFMFSMPIKQVEQKYIKIFGQILANS